MASVEILTIPIGSQLTSTIGANDKENKNDFPVLFLFSENVSNLTESGITFSAGATLVSLEGRELCLERDGASAANGNRDGDGDCRGECGIRRECPNL